MELMAGTEPGNLPKSYSMDMSSEDLVPMLVFSESSQGKCCVEGKILNKLGVKPHDKDIDNYGKLFRERLNKYKAKSRQIQVISNEDARMTPMPGMFGDNKIMAAKRCRRDRSEMEEIMFKLFERQPNWTLRQLIQETDQPKPFLRDLLKDLCVFNYKGSNKGSYELKPQYKVNKLE
ncbi:hypothetical protein CIPAW_02G175400 [Carya illinoinensis]|nr:hypothetical protein CIPAW_02G175400 [Carya illinoinensis]